MNLLRTNIVVNRAITSGIYRSIHISRIILQSNTPRYDEAELLTSQINSKPYKAKTNKTEYKWPDQSEEQMKKDYEARVEKMMRLSAVFQGMFFLAIIGIGSTLYMKWPQVKNWWITRDLAVDDDTIEKLVKIKEKKKLAQIPLLSEKELSPDVPGLYYWGGIRSFSKSTKPGSAFPRRNSSFDNMFLRDVCLSIINGKEKNLAIDQKGNLLEWDNNGSRMLLPDQNLVTVKESNGCAYALNKKGELLIIPLRKGANIATNLCRRRSFLLPWKKYTEYDWKLETKSCFSGKGEKKIVDFDVGKNHLVLISNVGKAYSCSTGAESNPSSKSCGQFGIPEFSQFDEFPSCNKLYEIVLLNNGLDENEKVYKRHIEQVACGDNHTLARDSNGELFVFGSNKYGQLGYPISYNTEQIAFPKILTRFQPYFDRDSIVRCVDLHCSGETSFVGMVSSPILKKRSERRPSLGNIAYFSFGNGQFGELGNGRFMTSLAEPTLIKAINGATEDNKIEQWSCGHNHVICKTQSGEVLVWGSNDNGQLGNGKHIKQCKPQYIPYFLTPAMKKSPEEIFASKMILLPEQAVATGELSSCVYWKK